MAHTDFTLHKGKKQFKPHRICHANYCSVSASVHSFRPYHHTGQVMQGVAERPVPEQTLFQYNSHSRLLFIIAARRNLCRALCVRSTLQPMLSAKQQRRPSSCRWPCARASRASGTPLSSTAPPGRGTSAASARPPHPPTGHPPCEYSRSRSRSGECRCSPPLGLPCLLLRPLEPAQPQKDVRGGGSQGTSRPIWPISLSIPSPDCPASPPSIPSTISPHMGWSPASWLPAGLRVPSWPSAGLKRGGLGRGWATPVVRSTACLPHCQQAQAQSGCAPAWRWTR